MERVLSWLNQPLFPDTVIRVWMAVAAGAALLLALILAFFLIRRKKKKKRGDQAVEEPIIPELIRLSPERFKCIIPPQKMIMCRRRWCIIPRRQKKTSLF